MFAHRVDGQQPIEYNIEGLKYEELLRERGSETTLKQRQNTFKLYKDQCLTLNKGLVYFMMLRDTRLQLSS